MERTHQHEDDALHALAELAASRRVAACEPCGCEHPGYHATLLTYEVLGGRTARIFEIRHERERVSARLGEPRAGGLRLVRDILAGAQPL